MKNLQKKPTFQITNDNNINKNNDKKQKISKQLHAKKRKKKQTDHERFDDFGCPIL